MEYILAVLMGLGFSIACGARISVAFFLMSIFEKIGYIQVSSNFDWIGSTPAIIVFGIATIIEIVVYYIPLVDTFLDSIKPFVVSVAGIIATASFITDMNPMLSWIIAIIAGGGLALASNLSTSGVRAVSTATTGGLSNFLISTWENIKAFAVSIVSVILPYLVIFIILITFIFSILTYRKMKKVLSNNKIFFFNKKY